MPDNVGMGQEHTPQPDTPLEALPPPVTERAAARYIGMSLAFLRQARREGHGPRHFRIGRAVRYRLADLEAWLEKHRL